MNCADALARYQPTGRGNVFLSCDGFGISYNPAPGSGISMFAADNDDGETAIVTETKFFILNGDFRKEYAAIAHEGLNACLRFFAEHDDIVSSWSASVDDANAAISEQTP